MAKRRPAKTAPDVKLTEHEGILLSLLLRQQPATAYQLYRIFEHSPVSSINTSKGQLYPAIRRLRDRQLIEATKVAGDGRKTEELRVTQTGVGAVRDWVKGIEPAHIVLDDPLRTRMLSLEVLSREERLAWIAKAKALVKDKREIVDQYDRSVNLPHQRIAYASAVGALRAKMEWLDELLYSVASE